MKIHSTIVAGAALAAMTLVPVVPASAGGGVQLNFGGPLGTFTARPHGGGGGHYAHEHSYRAHKPSYAHKKAIAEQKAAARRSKIAEARELEAKRQKEAAERKRAAEREAAELAKRKAVAAAKAKAEERARASAAANAKAEEQKAKVATAKRTKEKPETVKTEVAALENVAKAAPVEQIVKADKVEQIETAATPVPVKAPSISPSNVPVSVAAIESDKADGEILLKPVDVETKEDATTEVAANQSDEETSAEADSNAPQTCKRFVPSAGLTITVPCGD